MRCHPWGKLPPKERPKVRTPLQVWLEKTGVSARSLSQKMMMPQSRLWELRRGRRVPSLGTALLIEWATDGEVPCSAWLSHPVLKQWWDGRAARYAKEVKLRREAHRKQYRGGKDKRYRYRKLAEDPLLKLEDPYADS